MRLNCNSLTVGTLQDKVCVGLCGCGVCMVCRCDMYGWYGSDGRLCVCMNLLLLGSQEALWNGCS